MKLWGPSVDPTGDPGVLDPSEVLDIVPISVLHGSSFCNKFLMRMVWEWFPMYNCLIGILVTQCGQLTGNFGDNALYMLFIYMYIVLHVCT